ncbi:hypothetical protein [Nonomuraea sp. NPDC049480]
MRVVNPDWIGMDGTDWTDWTKDQPTVASGKAGDYGPPDRRED